VGIERPRYGAGSAADSAANPPGSVGSTPAIERAVDLVDAALATSGDYRNYFERYGVRYSYIMDPRTLRPVRHRLASVSVFDPSYARADALAIALLVLGEQDDYSIALAHRIPALFLARTPAGGFQKKATPEFEARARPRVHRVRRGAPANRPS